MKIFTFGSNLAGIHGAGAAAIARTKYGAIHGRGVGLNGKSYAIPTKDQTIRTLPLPQVERYVRDFINFAIKHPEFEFQVTKIGCGLAGFTSDEIAPLFRGAPKNCSFDTDWKQYLGEEKKYWGHYK